MKDQFFSGPSVEAALSAASTALGLPPASLRYVVLAHETPSRLGLSATPARIAVILDVVAPRPPRPAPASAPSPPSGAPELVAALSRTLGLEIAAEFDGPRERGVLHLSGPGCQALFEPQGQTFQALEHLLGRISAAQGQASARLSCEAYREARDAWLAEHARELGRAVLADGQQRETAPMNAYDRRLIHAAIGQLGGLETRSVGEHAERHVTIVPASPPAGA
jgi:spoIIIJ-associated protein